MNDASLSRTLNAALVESDRTSDAELIRRFVAAKDEVAFELLLRRHADVVWNICRSILRDDLHAAEDAFQTTFIAFARQASILVEYRSLGAWLFRVARHAALRIRKRKLTGEGKPLADSMTATAPAELSIEVAERAALVAEEVDRLPARYREPVILCFYRGFTHVQAAIQLGLAVGTVASRIARAKDKLRKQLSRRGVVAGSSMAAVIGVADSGTAHPALISLCIRLGLDTRFVPGHILTLTNEVISAMRRTQGKWLVIAPILAAGIALGGVLGGSMASQPSQPEFTPPRKTDSIEFSGGLSAMVRADRPSIAGAKERAQSQRNLSRIAEAIKTFQALNGYLPTDIVDKDGKALLSWRVVILPYLDQRNLYKLFKLDEAWDSEINKPLGKILVKLFMGALNSPADANGYGLTYVKRFTGPNTLHRPGEKVDLTKTPDGTSLTLLLAEVGEPIPWTKPDDPLLTPAAKDKPFVPKKQPVWTGPYKNVINVAFGDGTSLSLKPDLSPETVASLIYWNDGMVLPDRDELQGIIPLEQERADIKDLLKTLREMTDQVVKLSEEESKLWGELAKLSKRPTDPAVHLADEVLEIDIQLRNIRSRVKQLQAQIEKAKKAPGK